MASPYHSHLRSNQQRSGVFISYARSDGSEFAYRWMKGAGFKRVEQYDFLDNDFFVMYR